MVTAVCLQVRLDSQRLPEKALIKLEDLTIIEHAMRAIGKVDADLFLLLTTDECLSRLEPLAGKWGFKIFSGPKENVLKRFTDAADFFGITTAIRATGDNPLVSAQMANEVLKEHRALQVDYTNWTGAPLGTGIEIVETKALKRALSETEVSYDREHVTPWIYNNPDKFKLNIHIVPANYYYDSKVSVDTEDDLIKMKRVFRALYKSESIEVKELIAYLKKDILLIPSTAEGNGSGHVKRMLSLMKSMDGRSDLFIDDKDRKRIIPLLCDFEEHQFINTLEDLSQYSKIIVDRRSLEENLYEKYLKGKNIIAIDEGGDLREKIPYLIDILPLPSQYSTPNVRSVSFLDLPEYDEVEENGKILVTFGGEDPSGLTEIFCRTILSEGCELISQFDIVLGALYKGEKPDSRFNIIDSPGSLHHILQHYSGVITSFGITAYEASALKKPVLLINPSDYHQKLGEISQFFSAGVKLAKISKLWDFLNNLPSIQIVEWDKKHNNLGIFIDNLNSVDPKCPLCSSVDFSVVERFESRSYCRCDLCGILFMLNYSSDKIVYDKEYFFDQYENQYGKTYLDDFEHLSQLAQTRLDIIVKKIGKEKSILDVGCAYGPFLKKADENQMIPFGTDISSDAAGYVSEHLGYPVLPAKFDQFTIPEEWNIEKFEALTMWYVIEHFSDLSTILKKVNILLKIGGIFAFSTPSGSGISAKKNISDFLLHSPEDHYTIWEPDKSEQILKLFGFQIYKKRVTGHHPERFPSFLSKNKTGRKLLNIYSYMAGLGDTFEIYACKVSEL